MLTTEDLTTAALALPPVERANLADVLLTSLEPTVAPERLAALAAFAEARLTAFERGDGKTLSREEVMSQFRRSEPK